MQDKIRTFDEIPIVWIPSSELDANSGLHALERQSSDSNWSSERKFIVAELKLDGNTITIIRTGRLKTENYHKLIEASLIADLKSDGLGAVSVSVKGGGYIRVDYSNKEISFICESSNYGAADPYEVTAILKKGLKNQFKWFRIHPPEGEDVTL